MQCMHLEEELDTYMALRAPGCIIPPAVGPLDCNAFWNLHPISGQASTDQQD